MPTTRPVHSPSTVQAGTRPQHVVCSSRDGSHPPTSRHRSAAKDHKCAIQKAGNGTAWASLFHRQAQTPRHSAHDGLVPAYHFTSRAPMTDLAAVVDTSNVYCLNTKSTHPVANLLNPGSRW